MTSHPTRRRQAAPPFKPSDFIARRPVFRLDELRDAHTAAGRSPRTSAALLAYHVEVGHIVSVRRGLYVAAGEHVDPWLLGSRLAADAVLAYDGALSFHGLAPLGHHLTYLTRERTSHFTFGDVVYAAVRVGVRSAQEQVERHERAGLALRVTSRERTLVDLLDRLDLAPPLPELFSLVSELPGLDVDAMVLYALALRSRVLAARLGLFLSYRRDLPQRALDRLERRAPRGSTYFDRRAGKGGQYFARWRLVVPGALADELPTWSDGRYR